MTELWDRIWCRIFHRRYHVEKEQMYGWQFIRCVHCEKVWPRLIDRPRRAGTAH
jgi:hypothetical protein